MVRYAVLTTPYLAQQLSRIDEICLKRLTLVEFTWHFAYHN